MVNIKKLLVVAVMVAVAAAGMCADFKVMSYNIRMSTAPKEDGANAWENRKEATLNMVKKERPLVIGMQEVCADQVEFLDANLKGYSRIGVGREDGKRRGEAMMVYYSNKDLDLLDEGTFWLSETPDTVSRGWDGQCKRTCTWGHFRMKKGGRDFYVFNTHLDHRGKEARKQSMILLADKIREMVPDGTPVFLTADFNSDSTDAIFLPVKEILSDARETSPKTDRGFTYNGWNEYPPELIDHIFFRGFTPKSFEVLRGDYGAPFISDHYPVVVKGKLE